MDKIRDYLRGSCVLLSDIAVICLIFYMIPTFTKINTVSIRISAWIIFALLLMLADYIMASIGISVNLYLIINAAAILAGTYVSVNGSYCSEGFHWFPVLLGCGAAAVGIHGAAAAWRLPSANTILRYVDGLVVLLAFYLYAVFDTGLEPGREVVMLTLAAVFFDLVCVNQIRTREEGVSVIQGSGTGSKLVLAAVSAGIVLITGGVTGAASGQVHSAVDVLLLVMKGIAKGVSVIFKAVGFIINKIFALLVLLLPDAPQEAGEMAKAVIQEENQETAQTGIWVLPDWVMPVLMALFLIFAFCYILYRFRNTRIKRVGRNSVKTKIVRKNHGFTAWRNSVKRIGEAVWFECCYLRYRMTPEGLLVWTERIGKQKKMGRRKNESPGEYMRRMAVFLRYGQADHMKMDIIPEIKQKIKPGIEPEKKSGKKPEKKPEIILELNAETKINAELNIGTETSMSDAEALEKLAGILDRIYYSPISQRQHICGKEELLRYAAAVRNIKKVQLPSAKLVDSQKLVCYDNRMNLTEENDRRKN